MADTTPHFPTATAQNRRGLTILHCGRCSAHAVRVPPLPPDADWKCPWCGCRQTVDWQPAEAVRALRPAQACPEQRRRERP